MFLKICCSQICQLKSSVKSLEKYLWGSLFFVKLPAGSLQLIGIFQGFWLQRSEHLFCRISFSGCFQIFAITVCQVHCKNPVMWFCECIHEFFQQYLWCKLCSFVKKRFQHSCFLVNIAKFLRTSILKNFCERLLLKILFFTKYSDQISFYKNKNEKKRNSIEITQA